MRAIDIDADLAALAKQARSVSHQRAALSVQGIALRVRAVLPEVTAVCLTWAATGPFLEPPATSPATASASTRPPTTAP